MDLETGEKLSGADEPNAGDSGSHTGPSRTDDGDASVADESPDEVETDTEAEPEFVKATRKIRVRIPVGGFFGVLLALGSAGAWVALRLNAGDPMYVLAWSVGVFAGAGFAFENRGFGSERMGTVAVWVTGVCILGAMVGGAAVASHRFQLGASQFSDEHKQLSSIADGVVAEWENERELDWPSWGSAEKVAREYRYWPFGYPADVEAEARARYSAMPVDERQSRLEDIRNAGGVIPVFLRERDISEILWILLGLVSAHQIASGAIQSRFNRFVASIS